MFGIYIFQRYFLDETLEAKEEPKGDEIEWMFHGILTVAAVKENMKGGWEKYDRTWMNWRKKGLEKKN